ncbi:hypothetical protein SO694_00035135 [Aureococcus anophagefferens]|uniref:Fe2OG dioxygenase domain-containing protein n=1 Tax=Aureococcus anophagefferens TaxID=44056 RepID=A0ABR1FKK7_AURAN
MGSGNSVERQAFVAESEDSPPDIRDAAAKLMAEVRREDRPPPAWEEVPRARESFATFGSSHGRGSFDDVARFDHKAAGRESFEDATGRCSFYDVRNLAAAATPAWQGDARPERSGAAKAAGVDGREAPAHDDITGETWHRGETSPSHDDITGETWHRGETSPSHDDITGETWHRGETSAHFLDSRLVRGFLAPGAADELLDALRRVPGARAPKRASSRVAYEVRTDAYGVPRADGALALDAWGADYEAWARLRAAEAAAGTPALANSLAVNYYRGGAVGIPAHQDTVSSLVDGSAIYVLSLGATREFQLGGADAAGRARVEAPLRTWRPRHGDLVVLGPETNARCCHCVPRAPGDGLRVSIVFRSVDKSFLRKAPPRVATYASGAARVVAAEAVVGGARRHLSELISAREAAKAPAEARPADLAQFYRGRGPMAALLAV